MKSLDNEREREEVMRLSELQIGKTATILSVGGKRGFAAAFFRYGLDSGDRGHSDEICSHGRPH